MRCWQFQCYGIEMKRPKPGTLHRFWSLSTVCLLLFSQGCATTRPLPSDPTAYKDRAKSSASGDVTVTVAVPTPAEAEAIFGVKLKRKFIQPVWVEVKNDSAETYWFLPSGMDPNYFSPSEVAFAFHTASKETNRRIDDTFIGLQFQNPVLPGVSEAGFVLTNLD